MLSSKCVGRPAGLVCGWLQANSWETRARASGSLSAGGNRTAFCAASRSEVASPRRGQLAVTGEDDGLRRSLRDIRRDLASTVVVKRLGDEPTR